MSEFIINKKEHIQHIINNFDFQKVYNVMYHLGWTWFDNDETPTISRLKNQATRLLNDVYDVDINEEFSVSTGGFKATKFDDNLQLTFIIEEEGSDILNHGTRYEKLKKSKERKNKIDKINKNEDN